MKKEKEESMTSGTKRKIRERRRKNRIMAAVLVTVLCIALYALQLIFRI